MNDEEGFTYTAKAEAILLGLGFSTENWQLETKNLSGGQKNRLGLARLLLSNPDILLLDEPTNHMDVGAVEWLESFLQTFEKSFVIISHDRYFLDRTCRKIIEIERGKAVSYKGNYSQFMVEREERREQQQREYENQQTFIAKNQEFIRRNLAGQKTKMAKSRRTMLEKLERVDAVIADKSSGNFNLKKIERAGSNILTVEDLAIGYGTKVLADNINFSLLRGECLGIIGGNGTGKTTFLKSILGQIRELSGSLVWGAKTDIGYYSQQLEELDERNEIIGELRRVAPMAENGALRSFLAQFLFIGEDVFKRVGDLSGGEKGRLALAKLIYSQKNVLILDEPTNHLDIPSREALEAALSEYEGTIITVSHDRYFLDQISTQIFAFEDNGEIEVFNGNYSEYHDWKESQKSGAGSRESKKPESIAATNGSSVKEQKKAVENNLSKNEQQKIEERIKEIENQISVKEKDLAKITTKMSLPEIVASHSKLQEVSRMFEQTEKSIQKLYQEWESLSEKTAN